MNFSKQNCQQINQSTNINNNKLIFKIILSVCVLVPLTNDMFISGIPEMAKYFVGENISLVLSFSLAGAAIAQFFYGSLSDHFGRKPVLMAGLCLYAITSAQVMFAHSFAVLLIGRFLQAIGVCSAIVSALAIARDTCDQDELVSATGMIMAILSAGPALAPLLGSFFNYLLGWRASFIFLFILGCFYLCWIKFFLQETHTNRSSSQLTLKNIIKNYSSLIKQYNFLSYCFTAGFTYGILFSYIGLSALFIIQQLHFSLISFGIIVAINAVAIILMSFLSPSLIRKLNAPRTVQLGLGLMLCGGLIMWLLNYFTTNIYTFMIPMFVTTLGVGIIRTAANAGAMQLVQSKTAGSASAFLNLFAFTSGSIATSFAGKIIHNVKIFGLFITLMVISALLVTTLFDQLAKKQDQK